MKRTTVFLDERLEQELRLLAREDGRPSAALVREALESYVASKQRARRSSPGFVAIGRSGRSDTAERHEELLFAKLAPRRRTRRRRS
jgi:predicted transcriptional regulator